MSWDAYKLALLREMGLTAWVRRDAPTPQAPSSAVTPVEAVEVAEVAHQPVPTAGKVEPADPAPATTQARPAGGWPAPPRVPETAPTGQAAPLQAAAHAPTGVPAASIASMDWPALHEAVAGCTACKLCRSRRQTVFGVGALRADWMIVGEAPGEQEDLKGEPFVGPAGKLLDQMLHAVGLARDPGSGQGRVYIANVLKCRPPHNRNPEPEEMARCEPFLKRQIELVQPRIILAMGRFAVQTLLQSQEAIGRLRGRVHRYQGIPVVVTYHPAYLLRNLPDKAKAWDDLCLAVHQLAQDAAAR